MEPTTVTHQPAASPIAMETEEQEVEQEVEGLATGSDEEEEEEKRKRRSKVIEPEEEETEPVLTQPGLGVTTTTVTTITQTGGGWSTGLLDVCGDTTTCLLGALLPCCLDLSLSHQYGECLCLPLLPGSTFALRVGIRERYKIRGSVCEDWAAVCCCYQLAVCQMIREMKRRMKTQTYHVSTALHQS